MKLLEERIKKDGVILPGDVLKVGGFINHKMDIPFLDLLCLEIYNRFKDEKVTKILTVEASGIGMACLTARYFGVPVVFGKKSRTSNMSGDVYSAEVPSYTHGNVNSVVVPKEYLSKDDSILLIDDFLATGSALFGLQKIVNDCGAKLVGAGIIIEKAYQDGGKKLRESGMRVESLARIASMSVENGCTFVEE